MCIYNIYSKFFFSLCYRIKFHSNNVKINKYVQSPFYVDEKHFPKTC